MEEALAKAGWKIMGFFLKSELRSAKRTAEEVKASCAKYAAEGHSAVCAQANAADDFGLLDASVTTVVKAGGGCAKCNIR